MRGNEQELLHLIPVFFPALSLRAPAWPHLGSLKLSHLLLPNSCERHLSHTRA